MMIINMINYHKTKLRFSVKTLYKTFNFSLFYKMYEQNHLKLHADVPARIL